MLLGSSRQLVVVLGWGENKRTFCLLIYTRRR